MGSTLTHCRLRLAWSGEHALWTQQQWAYVMFSDECRFILASESRHFHMKSARISVYGYQHPSSSWKHRSRMPLIGRYHPYGMASILTGLESSRACMGHAWTTSCSPSTTSYISTRTSESIA
ncbi:nibrin [Trichonephila clavipes]|nr:nibrin [Trichonephila clavipes]